MSIKTRNAGAQSPGENAFENRASALKAPSPSGGLLDALTGVWERRWLAIYFVRSELSHSYRGSFLGIAWLVLNPLLMITLYTIVFSEILGLRFGQGSGAVNFGLYLYCGLIPFSVFTDTVSRSVTTAKRNSGLVRQVVFPLEVLPISTAVTNFLTKLVGLGALVVVVAFLEREVQWTLLLLPLVMIPQMAFTLGLGSLAAVLGAYVPDVKETLRTFLRALFFVTPIIWPASRVPDDYRFVVDYNPLAHLVEMYRDLVLRGDLPDWSALFWFSLVAAVLLVFGLWLFARTKGRFADLV